VQLGLEYSPAPPFNAGRPETAPPEILATVRQLMDTRIAGRIEAARAAAARLEASA
jgi:hypothetical protein